MKWLGMQLIVKGLASVSGTNLVTHTKPNNKQANTTNKNKNNLLDKNSFGRSVTGRERSAWEKEG